MPSDEEDQSDADAAQSSAFEAGTSKNFICNPEMGKIKCIIFADSLPSFTTEVSNYNLGGFVKDSLLAGIYGGHFLDRVNYI